jgi:hypothetical protein
MFSFWPAVTVLDGGAEDAWREGFNARNNLWGIKLWKRIRGVTGVFAQEYVEWQRKARAFLVGVFACVALSVAGAVFGVAWLVWAVAAALPVGLVVSSLWRAVGLRQTELFSHMVEVLVAAEYDGEDFEAYLLWEASGMFYPWLKDMTAGDKVAGMLAHRRAAERWVSGHRKLLDAFHARIRR